MELACARKRENGSGHRSATTPDVPWILGLQDVCPQSLRKPKEPEAGDLDSLPQLSRLPPGAMLGGDVPVQRYFSLTAGLQRRSHVIVYRLDSQTTGLEWQCGSQTSSEHFKLSPLIPA